MNELLDTSYREGYNRGYHIAVESLITAIRLKILEPGRSLGTRNVLEALISDARILDLNNARKNV